jgi:hypothetical protein
VCRGSEHPRGGGLLGHVLMWPSISLSSGPCAPTQLPAPGQRRSLHDELDVLLSSAWGSCTAKLNDLIGRRPPLHFCWPAPRSQVCGNVNAPFMPTCQGLGNAPAFQVTYKNGQPSGCYNLGADLSSGVRPLPVAWRPMCVRDGPGGTRFASPPAPTERVFMLQRRGRWLRQRLRA